MIKVKSRGVIVKNDDQYCFKCNNKKEILDYFMCMNGEVTGYCLPCLEILQN